MTADIKLLPLPIIGEGFNAADIRELMTDYASANVAHATAAKDAEIEALRVDVEAWKSAHGAENDACHHFQGKAREAEARAERLAEALRLVATAKDRGFGIDYARGVAKSALRDHDKEGKE